MPSSLLLRRRSVAAGGNGGSAPSPASENRFSAWLRSDATSAQFVRFVMVGGSTTVVYAVLFLALAHVLAVNYLAAHVSAIVVSTALANEVHRRLTFHAGNRITWFTAQWEAGSVSLIGLVATSTALGWLDAATGTAHHAVQIAVVVSVTAIIGALRFVVLRWIFRPADRS